MELLTTLLMNIVITTGIFMLTRYVFLEPPMEEKKQRIFYIVSYVLLFVCYLLVGEGAQVVLILLGGLNIALGRKKHRLLGFLLIVPLIGIMDGACTLLVLIQQFLLPVNKVLGNNLMLVMYALVGGLLLLFYVRGKQWRMWFSENMRNRRPVTSEYIFLCVAGTLSLVTNYINSRVAGMEIPDEYRSIVFALTALCNVILFTLTLAVVVLILQGNHRKFYHDRISNMQFNMIATMADIVENRDSNTGGHIKRTARYVEIIGKKLKNQNAFPGILTDQYLYDMIVAAPLHDIGKINIPDAILNKPGRLTEEEFAIMKTHTTAGRDALEKAKNQLGGFEYLDVAQDMAEYHHEWWNGNGYPNGIEGEEIPLCARIMAVADVFDALTSKRCYKEAMPLEKAYDIIQSETGTHFDPLIGEIFLSSKEEIEKAMEELGLEDSEEFLTNQKTQKKKEEQ